jgi:prepilin-type N-terminal cleavage/methylation domain-containing protein
MGQNREDDGGFTLIELLIVIVILGVLATVTVVAVRGITDLGQENSCAAEMSNLMRAEERHSVLHGSYAAEADLVANAVIVDGSVMYDVTLAADQTYAITPAVGSSCTQSGTGGGTSGASSGTPLAAPDRTAYAIPVSSSAFGSFHGNPGSFQVTPYLNAPSEVVVFGRADGLLDWHDMLNSAQPGTQRVTFVNLDNASATSIASAIDQARSNGPTTVAYYPSDDPSNTDGATISQAWNANPAPLDRSLVTLVAAPASGTTLTQLLNSIG